MGLAQYAEQCFEYGQRRSVRNLEALKSRSIESWRREVRLRYLDRLLVTYDESSPIYAQTLEEWHQMRQYTWAVLEQEKWFDKKLGAGLFTGDTDYAHRRDRARTWIKEKALGDTSCGKRKGKETTFAQMFQVIYEEPLG